MKRVLLIILSHLLLFFIVFVYQAQAEEEWTIDSFKDLTFARVSGEVIHGDSLNFLFQEMIIVQKFITILHFILMKSR